MSTLFVIFKEWLVPKLIIFLLISIFKG